MDIKIFFAILSGIIGTAAFAPYIRDTWTKKTVPHVFTWLIWTITKGTATAGLIYGDGGAGAIPMIISVMLALVVVILSIRDGFKYIKKSDIAIFAMALLAIFVWWQLSSPLAAVIMVSIIDAIGYIPTFRKSYAHPWKETVGSWTAFALADGLAILALENYNLLTVSYLATITSASALLVVYLLVRRSLLQQNVNF